MASSFEYIKLTLPHGKKAFFASDFHLGAPDTQESRAREKKLVQWLKSIRTEAGALFLVGDLFDFWFEYKQVVPKGFTRFFAEISKFSDENIPVYVFTGNHDIWMFDYLQDETAVKIFRESVIFDLNGKRFFVGHGDGLGPGDYKFKLLKKIFTFRPFQFLFRWLHPDIGVQLAKIWSNLSRTDPKKEVFMGEDKERLIVFAKEQLTVNPANYYIFGHRHLPLEITLTNEAKYFNLGDWLYNYTYLEYDGIKIVLKRYQG